jgi:hypothetical protein
MTEQRRGFVVGYRFWRVAQADDGLVLLPQNPRGEAWRKDGPTEAGCHFCVDSPRGGEWHGPEVPSRLCDCGMHAFYSHEIAILNCVRSDHYERGVVTGAVIGWGRVIPHAEGWRSQYARIVAIAVGADEALGKAVADGYGVPLVHPKMLRSFALEYGEEIPQHQRGMSEGERFQRHHAVERRLYADEELMRRGNQDTLLLALTLARACCDGDATWGSVLSMLGRDQGWLRMVIQNDTPRYQIPYASAQTAMCEVPLVRTDGLCLKHSSHSVLERHPDGTITEHHFCTRHRAHAEALRRDVETRPWVVGQSPWNAGGALAQHFATDWLHIYRWANWEGKAWTPPPGCTLPQHPVRSQIRVLADPLSLGTPYPSPPDALAPPTVRFGSE